MIYFLIFTKTAVSFYCTIKIPIYLTTPSINFAFFYYASGILIICSAEWEHPWIKHKKFNKYILIWVPLIKRMIYYKNLDSKLSHIKVYENIINKIALKNS